MGLLNRLFGSTESIAKEIELDDKSILKIWRRYFVTLPKKKFIVDKLKMDVNFQKNLKQIKKFLLIELVNISGEEKKESELISDLEAIEHSQKVKRVHKLQQCLGYAKTEYEYAHGLLDKLHSILKVQIHLVNKLIHAPKNPEKLISHLNLQVDLELEITMKIEKIENFHDLFLSLVKGEHIIRAMDAGERRLLKRMRGGIGRIFSDEITEGVTFEWAMTVFASVEDKFRELEAREILVLHPDADFEVVNRPEFVDLVRKSILELRGRNV